MAKERTANLQQVYEVLSSIYEEKGGHGIIELKPSDKYRLIELEGQRHFRRFGEVLVSRTDQGMKISIEDVDPAPCIKRVGISPSGWPFSLSLDSRDPSVNQTILFGTDLANRQESMGLTPLVNKLSSQGKPLVYQGDTQEKPNRTIETGWVVDRNGFSKLKVITLKDKRDREETKEVANWKLITRVDTKPRGHTIPTRGNIIGTASLFIFPLE